jgi:hypothetical protein
MAVHEECRRRRLPVSTPAPPAAAHPQRLVNTDLQYGASLSPPVDIRDGDYPDLTGAALVMITAGVNARGK